MELLLDIKPHMFSKSIALSTIKGPRSHQPSVRQIKNVLLCVTCFNRDCLTGSYDLLLTYLCCTHIVETCCPLSSLIVVRFYNQTFFFFFSFLTNMIQSNEYSISELYNTWNVLKIPVYGGTNCVIWYQ